MSIKSTNSNQSTSKANGSTDSSYNAANAKKLAASLAASQRRDAARKQLLELKRKNKNLKEQMDDTTISISINGADSCGGIANENLTS